MRSQTALTDLTLENMRTTQSDQNTIPLIASLKAVDSPTELPILPRLESFTHINSIVLDHHYKPFLLSRMNACDKSSSFSSNFEVTRLKRVRIIFKRSKGIGLLNDPELTEARIASGLDLTVHYPDARNPQFNSSLGISTSTDEVCGSDTAADGDDLEHWASIYEDSGSESDDGSDVESSPIAS
ncbi:hypothetical protein AX16_005448 [Volvariella volvacea WC 439]|nr:hypothetical protein AX16_005448 [Volvariella volvacea WC 439]